MPIRNTRNSTWNCQNIQKRKMCLHQSQNQSQKEKLGVNSLWNIMGLNAGDQEFINFCPVCKKLFDLRRKVNNHVLRWHTSFKYHCQYCSKSYVNYASKYKHENSHGPLKHVCNVCKKAFQFKKNLTVHNRMHTGTGLYRCPKWPQFYTTKWTMDYHFNTHLNLVFKCDQCSLTTNTFLT